MGYRIVGRAHAGAVRVGAALAARTPRGRQPLAARALRGRQPLAAGTLRVQQALAARVLATRTALAGRTGQGTVEYVALILLVAGLFATVVVAAGGIKGDGIARAITDKIKSTIESVGAKQG